MGYARNIYLAVFVLSAIQLSASLLESGQDHRQAQLQLLSLPDIQLRDSDLEPNVARPHLDFERCARLHNKIVEIGWHGYNPGKDPSQRKTATWWDLYGQVAQNLSTRLSPSLVEFLKRAELPEKDLSFTYHLRGLSHPSDLWKGLEGKDDEVTEVVLYTTVNQDNHEMGLVFNFELNLAVYAPTMFDHAHSPALMYPLETALTMYLSMIDVGKIAAIPEGSQQDQPYSKPWVWRPYCETDVKLAVDEFTSLIDAILNRIPISQRLAVTEEYLASNSRPPLMDTSTLHALNMPPSLLRSFLSRAPKPPFPFVAPGLTIPTRSSLSRLFASVQVLDMYSESIFSGPLPPTLLFPSNVSVVALPNTTLSGIFLFGDPQTSLNGVTSGLYIVSQSEHYEPFTNGVKLILPFPLGANGFAKKANWEHVGSVWDLSQNYTDVYQMGTNSFIGNHPIMIHQVFRNWRSMVEEGLWEVDEMGVKEGVEAWKLADDEECWWRFKMDDALW